MVDFCFVFEEAAAAVHDFGIMESISEEISFDLIFDRFTPSGCVIGLQVFHTCSDPIVEKSELWNDCTSLFA